MQRAIGCTKALLVIAALAALQVTDGGPVTGKTAKTSRLAKYTTLCKIKDPKLDECVTGVLEDILKHAKTGLPELKIPAFEPFQIPEIDLKVFESIGSLFGGAQKSDKTKAFARNLLVYHASEFDLHKVKLDVQKHEFFVDFTFPMLQVEGEYDVNLIMFGMPIKSIGPVHVNVTDTDVKATIFGKTHKRKGNTFLQFNGIDIKVNFKDYAFAIDKLFKKDPNMNKALNDIIKTQKAEIRKMTLPMIEELAGKMVLQMANQILYDLPLEELFIYD